jgi:KUP system potassium uptake protein
MSDRADTHRQRLRALSLGALGVVYGDIGTSPLYALRGCFAGPHAVDPTQANVLGVLSLIFWALILIVSLKYLTFVMRADNKGEGGILALLPLAFPERHAETATRLGIFLTALGIFGAALLYGDGLITPAITVLSAVEGLGEATPLFKPFILPITVGILVALFSVQRVGTGKVGRAFGPVMLVWFTALALLGIKEVVRAPGVLTAINPLHGLHYLLGNGWRGFATLGSVFLVLTGAEALYADMGHFGRKPIRAAWFSLVLPALFLNYLGQGALVLGNPATAHNPFYLLAPAWALYPLVGLATAAAIIASQALISGAFSLTMQAVQLGYAPRMAIDHTSSVERGQIYVPQVNWVLMLACIGLVLGFRSSNNMAAAYGIAVVLTMVITTLLFYFAARRLWGWSAAVAGTLCGIFLAIELVFLTSNLSKVGQGGWFPLFVGLTLYSLLSTWKAGRRVLRERLLSGLLPMDMFMRSLLNHMPPRVPGTAVFMAGNPDGAPAALVHNLKHNKILHERVVILTLLTEEIPFVDPGRRVDITPLGQGFYRVIGRFGFMEDSNVPEVLGRCEERGFEVQEMETTFFLSRETIVPGTDRGWAGWRSHLFALMARNAQHATTFFRLPVNRVVELGMQVRL